MKAQCLSICGLINKTIRNRQVCATVQCCRVFLNKSLCMKSLFFCSFHEYYILNYAMKMFQLVVIISMKIIIIIVVVEQTVTIKINDGVVTG